MEQAYVSCTASYSRKVQVEQYQPEEFFASLTHHWHDKTPTKKEIATKYEELSVQCQQMVEEQMENKTNERGEKQFATDEEDVNVRLQDIRHEVSQSKG